MAQQTKNKSQRQHSNGSAQPPCQTVESLAAAKLLPVEFLRDLGLLDIRGGGVSVPYFDSDSEELFRRTRDVPGKPRFGQPKGEPLNAYGEWRIGEAYKQSVLVVSEGESDAWACWYHSIPAIGMPGAGAASCLHSEYLVGVSKVYVAVNSDKSGEDFLEGMTKRLGALQFKGQAYALRMPEGVKDLSDFRCLDPDTFAARIADAMAMARVIAVAKASDGEWSEPLPLFELSQAPPFPIEVLPDCLAQLAEEIAWAMNCPVDFAALPLLTFTAGAIGNARHLAITKSNLVHPSLYAVTVGRPGTAKSPPPKKLIRPFDEREEKWRSQYQVAKAAWTNKEDDDKTPEPILRRVIAENITTEQVAPLLCDNPKGLIIHRNEISGFMAGLNQYKAGGKGNDRQFFIEAFDGNTLRVDRKSDRDRPGLPLFVPDPCLSIFGTIQPDLLPALRGESQRGAPSPNDGWLDRWLFAYPEDMPARGEEWREINEASLNDWNTIVEKLLDLEMTRNADGRLRPRFVTMSSGARDAWQQFTNDHAKEVNQPDFADVLRGPWAKLRTYCGRLALVLHELRLATLGTWEVADQALAGETMESAVKLVNYFKGHCRKVMEAMGADPRVSASRRLLDWIATQPQEPLSQRDLYRALRPTCKKPEDLEPILDLLKSHGYIRPVDAPSRDKAKGRKPSPRFEGHPSIWVHSHQGQNGHNGQNATD